MPRPAEFNRDDALAAAQKLFWCQGYSATSLNDLLQAMGIGRGSFYAAFGDKRSVFIECLDQFYERTYRMMQRAWEVHQSPQAFIEFFHRTITDVPARRMRRGCMLVNTVLELAEVDDELNRRAAAHLSAMEALFSQCFRDCQRTGSYPDTVSAEDLGAHLMVLNQGLRVASRKGVSRPELQRTVETTLNVLGLAA